MSEFLDKVSANGAVLIDVFDERRRQDQKWGEQNHTATPWLAILAEEFGEVAKEVNEIYFRPHQGVYQSERLRAELIQVAAVAVAWAESLDRNELKECK